MTDEQPARTSVRTPVDAPGGQWWLEREDHGVTARSGRRPVAHVEVREVGPRVDLVFWVDERLPRELHTRLTRSAFEHPAVRPHRPVTVALPQREVDVLLEARTHVADAATRVAGATCLLEGRVR
jgi:hypothetical protein